MVRGDIGKSRPATIILPEIDHPYGKPLNKDKEGAGKLTSVWTVSRPSKMATIGIDFRKINKCNAAINSGRNQL